MSKVYRFTSNQDQNDQRLILHISSNTFHQRNCFVLWYWSVIIGQGRMSQRPSGRVPTYALTLL